MLLKQNQDAPGRGLADWITLCTNHVLTTKAECWSPSALKCSSSICPYKAIIALKKRLQLVWSNHEITKLSSQNAPEFLLSAANSTSSKVSLSGNLESHWSRFLHFGHICISRLQMTDRLASRIELKPSASKSPFRNLWLMPQKPQTCFSAVCDPVLTWWDTLKRQG